MISQLTGCNGFMVILNYCEPKRMFAGCWQLMWVHSQLIWVYDHLYSQIIWAGKADVCEPDDLCLRAATFRIFRARLTVYQGLLAIFSQGTFPLIKGFAGNTEIPTSF